MLHRLGMVPLILAAVLCVGACSTASAQMKAPPGGNFKAVSGLVPLPDFLPGLGTLYVDPATLPAGPFLAFDRQGELVSTIYMIPISDIQDHKSFHNLGAAREKVDHVDMYYNAGHPGVAVPHYHIVVWYVSPEKAAALK